MNIKLLVYQKVTFPLSQLKLRLKCEWWLLRSLLQKECYLSPFFGEFGHLLGHIVPFVTYLHKKGVKVHYCGMEIHHPFFVDENGLSTVIEFVGVRDFFHETKPMGNQVKEPEDIKKIADNYRKRAQSSSKPYLDLSNFDFYYNYFRWWAVKTNRYAAYRLDKAYQIQKQPGKVVIFPRKSTLNLSEKALFCNGEDWDYAKLVSDLATVSNEVEIVGHPSFSQDINITHPNLHFNLTTDNLSILISCAEAEYLISQHSGATYLGAYVNTQVIIIYKGANHVGEIEVTETFNNQLNKELRFDFAYSSEELLPKIKKEYVSI